MYDHHTHVMWQQHERRISAAAERRRSNLEALERSHSEHEARPPSGRARRKSRLVISRRTTPAAT